MRLVFTSWLAPSIPRGLHRALASGLAAELGCAIDLRYETAASGPPEDGDPFASGTTDLGWLCAPNYRRLAEAGSVELLPAPRTADPRTGGRPVYFSDVVVRRDDPARDFAALAGRRWVYNDRRSLSGWLALQARLPAGRTEEGAEPQSSGSHLRSLAMVARGAADAAAVDSNALALALARSPALAARLRVLESWGPHPIQPLVIASRLPAATRAAARRALLALAGDPRLARWRVLGFAPVREADYRSAAWA
jgi:phosphonate transport system substrate-binding protein